MIDVDGRDARSPLAAAVGNLTGLGLGYAYLGRWWRLALHLLVTVGLVVIAFATGAAALPWLCAAVAALWLGWMALDAARIARGWFAPPARQALPVALALLAVAAVVAAYVLYGAAGRAAYADAVAARERGDCTAAGRGFAQVTGVYALSFPAEAAAAAAGRDECAAYLAAGRAEQDGDFGVAVELLRRFRAEHPGSVLDPAVERDLRRVHERWGTALRGAGDRDGAVRVYQGLLAEVAGDTAAEPAAREQLATAHAERAADLRGRIPAVTGEVLAGVVRDAMADLLTVQRELPGTRAAGTAAQAAREVYAAASATWAGRPCSALPTLDQVVALPDAETGGAAGAALADHPRLLLECGTERYTGGDHAGAAEAFDRIVTAYPGDPGAAQARANAIAARAAELSGAPTPLPGPYAGDSPGPISVTFYNDNPEEVRVYVVGPTAHEFVVPGCAGCPAGYATEADACPSTDGKPSVVLRLPAGTYGIVGEYPSADPTVSSNVLEDGFVYTNCLYVVGS